MLHTCTLYIYPGAEFLRLHFISGTNVTTLHRVQNPERRRLVNTLTRASARDHTSESGDGQIMTVLEYFWDILSIQLRFPDLVCMEVCTTFFLRVACSHDP